MKLPRSGPVHGHQFSRRRFLGDAALLACWPIAPTASRAAPRLTTQEVAPGIHVRRGVDEDANPGNEDAIANLAFIVGRDAVAVVDPGGSLADGERLRAHIREKTTLPVRYVVMTHDHPDHIFGAGAFLIDRPQFLGHERMPESLARRGEYYRARLDAVLGKDRAGPVVTPNRLIHERDQIDLGDRVLMLAAHGRAHTDCDLTVSDRQSQTLFTGDLLFVERVPSLDGSLKGWQRELELLKRQTAVRTVPGHGPVSVNWPGASRDLDRYLDVLLRETRAAVKAGIDIDTAVTTVGRSERDKWTLFDDYHGHNVVQAFKEVEWE
jgi:quinoprotein relay system zinc metallohydrolase 2